MTPNDPTLSVAAAADPHQTSPFSSPIDAQRLGPNTRVGDYEILEEIAHGGMGVVYKARQAKLNRIVALKLSRAGSLGSDKDSQRFKAEAGAAAKLDHPHIVPIYEVGDFNGQQYFSMAYVEGHSLAEEVAVSPLPPRHAASLMRQVALAVAYAHTQGVIHRDLKPGNIMVDAAGQPRVTDFGLAKRTDADSSLTQAGQVMGTPSYMPPEQAEGKNEQVGPLADVYSLGATLYCLITGRPPFQSANVLETLKQVVEHEPVAPRSLNLAVDRDLNTIVLKCLQKRPEKRYSSATDLAEDLQRFLEHRPILARPVSEVEKLARWCRRNPAMAGSLAAIAFIVVSAFALVSWSYVRAEDARKEEAQQRQAADEARDEAQRKEKAERWGRYRSNIAAASSALQLQNGGAAGRALDDAPSEHRNWEWHYLHNQLDGASIKVAVPGGKIKSIVLSPSGAQIAVCCLDHNEVYLYDVATGKEIAVLRGHSARATSVAFRPDGRQMATASEDQTVRLWDPATGRPIAVLQLETSPSKLNRLVEVTYSSDGSRIATFGGWEYGPLMTTNEGAGAGQLWDTATGKQITVLAEWQNGIRPVSFSPDGKRVAVGVDKFVHLCDAETGRRIAVLGPHAVAVTKLVFGPNGKRLASVTHHSFDSYDIGLWDGENGREIAKLRGHLANIHSVSFSRDGSRLISGGDYPDNTARIWDAATGKSLAVLAGHRNRVVNAIFSSDGQRAVTASMDQTGRLWEADTGKLIAVLGEHTHQVWHFAFRPNEKRVVTASEDATLRLWDVESGTSIGVLRGHGAGFRCRPVFTPDGSRLISGSTDGTLRIWDMNLVERNGILRGHRSYVYDVAFNPNGRQVASAAWDASVRLWNPTTGEATSVLKHEVGKQEMATVSSVAYGRSGKRLTSVIRERGIVQWDLESGKADRTWRGPVGDSWADARACMNRAETLMASGCADGSVRLWDVASGLEVALLKGHVEQSIDVVFHPDGHLLASSGADGTVRLWDTDPHRSVAVLRGHTGVVWRLAFSADGKLLASGSNDGTIRMWNPQTHEQLAEIPVGSIVYGVAFSPDGTRLAAACRDNTIRLIDVASRQQVAELRGHTDYVHAVDWSPDGTRLVSGSGDFTVRVWDSLSIQERAKRTTTK